MKSAKSALIGSLTAAGGDGRSDIDKNKGSDLDVSDQSVNEHIAEIVATGHLPRGGQQLVAPLLSDDGARFVANESYLFDYKRGWFNATRDPGAAAILRSIAGFYNTFGGLLLVGVDNKLRTAGHNIVEVDIEALNTIIRENFSQKLVCDYRHYSTTAGVVDCVLVPKRPAGARPVRLLRKFGDYPPGLVWKREAHEILRAEPEDVVLLHGPRMFGNKESSALSRTHTIIPPTSATIQRFIGRQDALDDLFDWVGKPRTPRSFLWGRGGSGKSTIAYEFAAAIGELGRETVVSGRDPLDAVIYLSAKQRELLPLSARIETISSPDFGSRRELFEALLVLLDRGEDTLANIEAMSEDDLLGNLEHIFDEQSVLLVIDDLDTISTVDAAETGSEELFYILSRSKRSSKILYTQRDEPRLASTGVIEVKPLNDEEYHSFIATCCEQFGVDKPNEAFVDGPLAAESERRPLIIEVVIGLVRSCAGDFKKALELYKGRSGQDARRYLFEREYLQLANEEDIRSILFAIALFNAPMTIDDLEVVTRWDADRVVGAIQPVQNMFLEREETGDGPRFVMSVPARDYILDVSTDLPRRAILQANIDAHKAKRHQKGAALASLEASVGSLIGAGLVDAAWQRVEGFKGSTKDHGSPHFRAIRAIANAHRERPDLGLLRDDMSFAMDMRCATLECLLAVFDVEARILSDLRAIDRMVEYAESEKSLRQHERAEVFLRRAKLGLSIGYQLRDSNQVSAARGFLDSIRFNMRAQAIYERMKSPRRWMNHEKVMKSTWAYLGFVSFNRLWDSLPEGIRSLHPTSGLYFAESFVEPWLEIMRGWASGSRRIPPISANEAMDALDAFVLSPRRCYFDSEGRRQEVRDAIRITRAALKRL